MHYSYDKENNITGIENIAAAVNGLGGVYKNNYTYDDMYRLTAASGSFTDNNNTDFPFTLEMSYTASGNIATKNVTADILSADNTVSQLAYQGNYSYTSGKPHAIEYINGTDIDQAFSWDLNGNLSTHTDNIKSLNRYLCWDEENRLMAVKDQNYLSAFVYDAAGERVWKLSGEVTQMKISGKGTIDVASLNNKTLYVSPYVVYNQLGYSKHYYAGAERVSSRIGGGTLYGLQHPINDTISTITTESGYPELSTQLWGMLERSFSDCLDLYTDYIGYEPHLESVQESASQNNPETNWYIYHSDHLGSSSFLTDASGTPTQHLQYLPFGENYIEQRATTDYYTPYTFSAKERDLETGYSYFGARYYDPNVSVWLSVDPMADKYPSMSAFMYCAGNPVMLLDHLGLEPEEVEKGGIKGWLMKCWNVLIRGKSEDPNEFKQYTVTSTGELSGIPIVSRLKPFKVVSSSTNQTEAGSTTYTFNFHANAPIEDFSGFRGALRYIFTGGNINGYHYGWDGKATGLSPTTGTPPIPGRIKMLQGASVLQKGHTLTKTTLKAWNITKQQGKQAIESLKSSHNLPPDFHGVILSNGDYLNPQTKMVIDNILDYVRR